MENKNWFHDFEGCNFPKMAILYHEHQGRRATSLKTRIRFQRDSIWYKRVLIETFITEDESITFEQIQRFTEKVYEAILFYKIEKNKDHVFFDKPDSLQITEEERLLTEYPYLKEIYERL